MPTLDMGFPSGDSIQELKRYVHLMAEKLNYTLSNLDADNMNVTYQSTINGLAAIAEKAQALAKMLDNGEIAQTGNVSTMYESLRDSVFSSMEDITASFDSLITQTQSEIRAYVQANYMGAAEGITLEENLTSMISQTAEQVRLEFNTRADINEQAIDAISVQFGTYFSYTDQGLEIGKTGEGASDIVTRITNERIEFAIRGTDTVIAYIDAATNKLHIAQGTFEDMVAGVAGAQRVEVGYNAAFEPFVTFYDNTGARALSITKNSIDYGNGVRSAPWSRGDEFGVGDFIG